MAEPVILVEGLGKQYRIGARRGLRYRTLRDVARDALAGSVRRARDWVRGDAGANGNGRETIWALKDVNFQVGAGEVVGIIGRNGAGKSTLLKILSRITEPTNGFAEIRGRVGSLLEVGSGFHPELTGSENIFLNGAILGMRGVEIKRKFDEIVAFSELERFLDTPVKHYSSGMYMRLAFAVAAHLEPEILLVDEVLAVGDMAFQKKCLGKMGSVAREGRTVLFVSHNLGAVAGLCGRAVLLQEGRAVLEGPAADVIAHYIGERDESDGGAVAIQDDARSGFTLFSPVREVQVACGDPIVIEFDILCPRSHPDAIAGMVIYDIYDAPVVGASSVMQGVAGKGNERRWRIRIDMGRMPLNSGQYRISVWFGSGYRDHAAFSKSVSLRVVEADPFGWGNRVPRVWGHFYWKPEWDIQPVAPDGDDQ
jgi:lipopolysaccharide transport system ATP-binding protein